MLLIAKGELKSPVAILSWNIFAEGLALVSHLDFKAHLHGGGAALETETVAEEPEGNTST